MLLLFHQELSNLPVRCDLSWVCLNGAGHAFGINLDKCFDEVQSSNMSKLGEDGKPIYNEVEKVMKGPNYFKPDLSKYLI